MLFEENHCSEVTYASIDASKNLIMPEARRITLPSQEWAAAAEAYCGDRLSETAVGDIVTVKEYTHGGFIYAVFATLTGGCSGEYVVYAWQLLPLQVYSGKTSGAICSSEWDRLRARGDMTGMLVKVSGRKMVCAKPIHFVRSLPTVRPLSMEEAMGFELSMCESGWRSFYYRGAKSTWTSLASHPVCTYAATGTNPEVNILLWKANGRIQEYMLPSHQLLELQRLDEHPRRTEAILEAPRLRDLCQASLF